MFAEIWPVVKEILLSDQAIVVYATVVIFIYRWICNRYRLNEERWAGLIIHAFNAAEKTGLPAESKLNIAIKVFEAEFERLYGKRPEAQDISDARIDFAKIAYESKGIKKRDLSDK